MEDREGGYTYREIATQACWLLDVRPPQALVAQNGYFTVHEVVRAIEHAERMLFVVFKRVCPADFERLTDATYPANADRVNLRQLLREPVSLLEAVRARATGTNTERWTPVRRLNYRRAWNVEGAGYATDEGQWGYVWQGPLFRLLPMPTQDITLRFLYVGAPKNLLRDFIAIGAQAEPGDAAATLDPDTVIPGLASAEEFPFLPSFYHHLLPMQAALLLEAKRRDKGSDLLMDQFEKGLRGALLDAENRDATEPATGLDIDGGDLDALRSSRLEEEDDT